MESRLHLVLDELVVESHPSLPEEWRAGPLSRYYPAPFQTDIERA